MKGVIGLVGLAWAKDRSVHGWWMVVLGCASVLIRASSEGRIWTPKCPRQKQDWGMEGGREGDEGMDEGWVGGRVGGGGRDEGWEGDLIGCPR